MAPDKLTRRDSVVRHLYRPPTKCDHKSRSWSDRWKATVAADILISSALLTGLATMVTCVTELTSHNLSVSSSLLTVLGIVLGLVIGFRTSSAYERYQEGRKLWADIAVASGNLGQIVWSHVPDKTVLGEEVTNDPKKIEKKEVLKLIQAFSISVKHFISFEQRQKSFEQLEGLVPWLTKKGESHGGSLSSPSSTCQSRDPMREGDLEKGSKKSSSPPNSDTAETPSLSCLFRRRRNNPGGEEHDNGQFEPLCERCSPSPILPLRISLSLHYYVRALNKLDSIGCKLPDPILATLLNNLDIFQQTVINLERIRTTPIPYAYQIHLKFTLWVYIALLPFQVVDVMKWVTIPATLFASMLLLGFHAIGQQIENPFDGDANDLNMEAFCKCIQKEFKELIENTCPGAFVEHMKRPSHLRGVSTTSTLAIKSEG